MNMQIQPQQTISNEEIFELLVFLIMSSRTGLAHSLEFSIFRTISAAALLAEFWRPNCPEEHADFLDQFLDLVRNESATFETDQEDFKAFLTEASHQTAIHIKQIDWGV